MKSIARVGGAIIYAGRAKGDVSLCIALHDGLMISNSGVGESRIVVVGAGLHAGLEADLGSIGSIECFAVLGSITTGDNGRCLRRGLCGCSTC